MDTNKIDPSHYHMPIEPLDFTMANGLSFCEGNIIKYVCRWRKKDGVTDLKKARVYLDRLIGQAERERNIPVSYPIAGREEVYEDR